MIIFFILCILFFSVHAGEPVLESSADLDSRPAGLGVPDQRADEITQKRLRRLHNRNLFLQRNQNRLDRVAKKNQTFPVYRVTFTVSTSRQKTETNKNE